jgi:hypothetical protein
MDKATSLSAWHTPPLVKDAFLIFQGAPNMQYIILVSLYFYSLLNFSLSGFFFDSLKTFGIAFKHIFIPLSQ